MARQLVHNLTDVSTPALRQSGLVSTHLQVEGITIPPGGNQSLQITPALLANTAVHRSMGALCIGEPPKKYLVKRELKVAAEEGGVEVPTSLPELLPPEIPQLPEPPFENPVTGEEPEHRSSRRSRKKVDGD